MNEPEVITNSRLRSFSRCKKLHYYSYVALRRSVAQVRALDLGSLLHVAWEAWWTWWMPKEAGGKRYASPLDAATSALVDALANGVDGRSFDIDAFDAVVVSELIRGYDIRWFDETADTWDVLAVEAPFTFPIVNPDSGRRSQLYRFAGKIDAVLRRKRDGAEGFMESKSTVSSLDPTSPYWAKLRMDTQVSDYFMGAEALGYKPTFCLYSVTSKPTIRPLKATPEDKRKIVTKGDRKGQLYAGQREADETPEEFGERVRADIASDTAGYFGQAEISRLDEDLQDRRFDVWGLTRAIHEAKTTGHHSRNADACQDWGRPCSYFGPCSRTASIDDDALFRTAETAHEELNQKDRS